MKFSKIILILAFFISPQLLKAQELYVGTNYHPHDSNPAQWQKDIDLMKAAGFRVVRMGHLAWDSYEPTDGQYKFEWFDQAMDMMAKAGIKVILDIAVRPAPLWLHKKYPGIDITDASGNRLFPNHRYMEDVGDPDYQRYALRFADVLTKRYSKHPALLAFGIDNESGDGPHSFSEIHRKRFISWLKERYKGLDSLNKAWAGQRWSRRVSDWDEIAFPVSGTITGAPERTMDWRIFESGEISQFMTRLLDKVHDNAPGILTTTNNWYFSQKKYYDYADIAYSGKMDRNGGGFYPGSSLKNKAALSKASFELVKTQYESNNPVWGIEFTTMTAVPNSIRRSAYATLMLGNQMVCGWTWQTMAGGEEQYLQGMLDWDGTPTRKYDEYKKIAQEFKKIEKYGFPYKLKPEVGLAFSYPSQITSYAYPKQHDEQLQTWFTHFNDRNMDSRILDIGKSDLNYKLLVMPGIAVIDDMTAQKVRRYVENGGTVIMTAYSGTADIHNQVFTTTHPGLLSDVFGIRVGPYEETSYMNEIARDTTTGDRLKANYHGHSITLTSPRYDLIEPKSAKVLANITSLDHDTPLVTINHFGKGKAIYIGIPAQKALLDPLINDLIKELSITKGPVVPAGVMARTIDPKHILYFNNNDKPQTIMLKGNGRGILTDRIYPGSMRLEPYEPELIELK